ncbi:hypothetical protein H5410_012732 [Solanum commersonii]|uniref:3-beta hydroxysteroid dehydrogenase/isomerase domain-containing protein n=1 Tax=Solanum commersonii TaxID=4109 RepID=A0A9J6ATH4_SOLCO|nr:hypothetical protein H5410_012732 [Solanum commersonii]
MLVKHAEDTSKVDHLLGLDGSNERLHLFEAELLEEQSLILLLMVVKEELVDPAVKGTLNVLRSCAKSPSVRRVVITSSTASVICTKNMSTPRVVADETWYSDSEFCEQRKDWYRLSKTLAEQAAWKFAKENGIDLLLIINYTEVCTLSLFDEGKEASSGGGIYRLVDVRDVANAHILAFEVPSANGRYCLVGANGYSSLVLKILQKLYPSIQGRTYEPTSLKNNTVYLISF